MPRRQDGAAVIASLLLTLALATHATATEPATLPPDLAIPRAYFADHPELVGQPGTGWKQYERFRWFVTPARPGHRSAPSFPTSS